MKFFKGRLVHNIYLAITVIFFITGYLVSTYSNSRDIIVGVGKVLQYSFGVLFLLLLALYPLPRKVFYFWKYISIPFIIYIISYTINSSVFGDCAMIGCDDRDFGVYIISIISAFFSFAISIFLTIIFYFFEKNSKK